MCGGEVLQFHCRARQPACSLSSELKFIVDDNIIINKHANAIFLTLTFVVNLLLGLAWLVITETETKDDKATCKHILSTFIYSRA